MWNHTSYSIKNKMFSLLAPEFWISGSDEQPIFKARKKAFKLREDLPLMTADGKTEVLRIKARQIFDFGVVYDLFDSVTQQRLGALRRKGLRSMVRDLWEVLDFDDQVIGTIEEDNWGLALLRRLPILNMIPQHYHAHVNGQLVARLRRNTYILRNKMHLSMEPGTSQKLDTRFWVATLLLLFAVEGQQK
jgi:uncharacterized protein YxjI